MELQNWQHSSSKAQQVPAAQEVQLAVLVQHMSHNTLKTLLVVLCDSG